MYATFPITVIGQQLLEGGRLVMTHSLRVQPSMMKKHEDEDVFWLWWQKPEAAGDLLIRELTESDSGL